MFFQRIAPPKCLEQIIECYWIAEDESIIPQKQKIIPDGFVEIIFHYGDPYRICLGDTWQLQSRSLLAGQISKHFFLENTGTSGVIGIKLKPAALTHLYDLHMHHFTDKVVDITLTLGDQMKSIEQDLNAAVTHDQKIVVLNNYFAKLLSEKPFIKTPVDNAIDMIFAQNGMVTVGAISHTVGIGERQLENLFKKYVGLSPKFFARIIRFNYIFHLVQENDESWCGLAYEAAYYDQSHFIRNFRDFTGENPSDYAFDEKNMANFFLKKK
jgi:AraC-like DNA-binding protein